MTVAVIDYGSGNLRSVAKALARAGDGAPVQVITDADQLRHADRIVLPGVGAFADCLRGLDALPGMRQALRERVIDAGRPFLGICVGMQLMADWGREHGDHRGLGIADKSHAYFVHSYHFQGADPDQLLAETEYGGRVAALVGRDNLVGTQFHPEKSQAVGLRLIANFLAWRP